MQKFLGTTSIKREDLLEGKASVFKMLISTFLETHRFNTEYGAKKINQLLKDHRVSVTDDGIILFLQHVAGDRIGIMAFQDMNAEEEEYVFYLVSGSDSEIKRMERNIEDDSVEDENTSSEQ